MSTDFSYFADAVDVNEIQQYLTRLPNINANESVINNANESVINNTNESAINDSKSEHVKLSKILFDVTKVTKIEPICDVFEGVVYKVKIPGENGQPDKIYSMKSKSSTTFCEAGEQKELFNEVEIHASLKHESILPLIGFSVPRHCDENYSIITPFMENDTLEKLLKKVGCGNAPLNWGTIQVINIFGIAAGMTYIHQCDVIHRNLNTGNVFLDENYHPKITSFNVSGYCEKGSTIKGRFGTPIYMAPEVLNDSELTNKIDVFSYGLVLFELLTYKKPYLDLRTPLPSRISEIDDFLDFIRTNRRRRDIHPNEAPDIYVDLINKCLDENPDNRPSFVQIVNDFIDRKDEYFSIFDIDEEDLDDYIEMAIQGLKLN